MFGLALGFGSNTRTYRHKHTQTQTKKKKNRSILFCCFLTYLIFYSVCEYAYWSSSILLRIQMKWTQSLSQRVVQSFELLYIYIYICTLYIHITLTRFSSRWSSYFIVNQLYFSLVFSCGLFYLISCFNRLKVFFSFSLLYYFKWRFENS